MASPYVCPACGGTLREAEVDLTRFHLRKTVHFKNVPVDQCTKCKEPWPRNQVEQRLIRELKNAPMGETEIEFIQS